MARRAPQLLTFGLLAALFVWNTAFLQVEAPTPKQAVPVAAGSSVVSSSLASPCGRASKRGHSLVLGPGHRHDPRRDRQHYHLGVPGLHHLRFGRSGWQQPQESSVESELS